MTTPEPTVLPVRYTVSCLPEEDVNAKHFAIEVCYRGEGLWAVVQGDDWACLGADGTWAEGVKPHGRGDAWLAAHRFDEETALKLAREAAPHVTVNGFTVQRALAMRSEQ